MKPSHDDLAIAARMQALVHTEEWAMYQKLLDHAVDENTRLWLERGPHDPEYLRGYINATLDAIGLPGKWIQWRNNVEKQCQSQLAIQS